MGCVSGKPSNDPLKQKDQKRLEIAHKDNHQNDNNLESKPQAEPLVNKEKRQQTKEERDQSLIQSGKPQWIKPQFIPFPQPQNPAIENSPIQILYSDHQQFVDPHPTIKKQLFKVNKIENSVIHEVSQEYLDSRVHSQESGIREKPSNNLSKGGSPKINHNIEQQKIHTHQEAEKQSICEQQTLNFFELNLPKVQIFGRPVAA